MYKEIKKKKQNAFVIRENVIAIIECNAVNYKTFQDCELI